MKQKGFIQIPLLVAVILVSISAVSIGSGAILYKQQKLTPFIANISEIFKRDEETKPTEKKGTKIEEPQVEQELDVSQKEIFQQEQELEKAKLELEKARIEAETEKARLEADKERLKAEAEKLKAQQEAQAQLEAQQKAEEEAKGLVEEQRKQREQQLKIEQCKAQAQSQVDSFKKKLGEMYLRGQEALKNWERAILDCEIKYSECILKPIPEEYLGMSPDQLRKIKEADCSYYLGKKSKLKEELEQERKKLDTLFQTIEKMGETEYSRLYLECLNK